MLAVIAVLLGLAVSTLRLAQVQARDVAREATQSINVGLAAYIVAHLPGPLIDSAGHVDQTVVNRMATQAMMINPAIEIYVLDRSGAVRAHALSDLTSSDPVGTTVSLAPIHALSRPMPMLPVLGDDPRQPGRQTVISTAPLLSGAGEQLGWLYVVLEAEKAETTARELSQSRVRSDRLVVLAAATVVAALALLVTLVRLTRPLHRLIERVQQFHPSDEDRSESEPRTEIEILEQAIESLQRRITTQIARLHEADSIRRELVSNISHDLRTPLSSIQGYVETVLLKGDRLDAPIRTQHLRTALRHAELLSRRIADLFQLSTLDAGRVVPKLEVFCLAELLQDVVASYQLESTRRGVRLQFGAGSHLPTEVHADIGLIERVFQNLVDNALRHTPAGGSVTLALKPVGGYVEVSVSDTGSGITREDLPHVFERYWRAPASEDESARVTGTSAGLGLAIVKRILELHGSVVRVTSEPRQGTCFAFGLQVAT